ncbi:MAG: GTPase HflX [Prochlorococcus sp.]
MKQAHLAGRIKGLRPSQQRQLERLSHRRHPENGGADQLTLERLAEQVLELCQPLHLVLDSRGLCRLLWVGPLDGSGQLLAHLPESPRRKITGWRLISCPLDLQRDDLRPGLQDAIVALDLAPSSWLRFAPTGDRGGTRAAALWQPDPKEASGWCLIEINALSELCQNSQGLIPKQQINPQPLANEKERVLLLTLTGSECSRSERDLAELEGLVRSAGGQPVAVARQKQGAPNPQTLWGKGKLQEAALEVRRHSASLVITDRELTPVQVRNLERYLDCPVMDRSELILDIFAQRASSAAGRLQVELAQLRYRMPRLIGRGRSLSRQGGGIGTRGPGETQLEKDRRAIARRIERLLREVRQLQSHRVRQRNRRKNLPRVAIVGYTNAGKSSLLNALCARNEHSKVLAENKLFATLDPTTRRLGFPQAGAPPLELLLTDTVGFIRELPAPLVEAFRATLEETLEANLLLVVVDLSDPDWQVQLSTVHQLLDSLGAESTRQLVANQIDRCDSSALEAIRSIDPKVLYLSATSGAGLQGLKCWLEDHLWGRGAESILSHSDNT